MAPEVIIDPGHGGTQAYGGSSPTGVQAQPGVEEKHVNLELARRVAARLGSVAQMTRSSDINVPLHERAQMAARTGARVLVSIHANSGAQGLRGSEVWVHEQHDAGSAELAQAIHGSLDRVGPTRGLYRGPLAVLDPSVVGGAAACLIEADYLSDPQGRSRLTSARGLDELADAISSGVRSYLGQRRSAQASYGRVPPSRRDYDAYESDAYYPYAYGADDGMSYEYTVPGTVPMLRQPNGMACWATVTTMLIGWRDGQPCSIADALRSIGDEWFRLFDGGRGLSGRDKQRFLDQARLVARPPTNFGGIDWLHLLQQYGPLWVTGDVDPSEDFAIHARIMTHIHGDGSRDGTTVWLIDPGTGTRTELTLGQFMDQFESEAATPGVPLRIQVVHWPAGARRSSSQGYDDYEHERGRGLGGLPNLSFGPPGPNGRPLGAVMFNGTPIPGTPVQIMWTDYNLADTDAGSYSDEVCVFDSQGNLLHREELRVSGVAAGGSTPNYILWTPREPGPVTARVRLNSSAFAIPEERTDDNESTVGAVVGTRIRGARAFGSGIAVREVNSAGQLGARYRADQNVGFNAFIGFMSARQHYSNRFILLLWAQGNAIDVDLCIELFDRDPRDDGAQLLDSQVRRTTLADGQRFGYEYSRLPDTDPIYFRITYTEYSSHQRSGEYLWMNGYG